MVLADSEMRMDDEKLIFPRFLEITRCFNENGSEASTDVEFKHAGPLSQRTAGEPHDRIRPLR